MARTTDIHIGIMMHQDVAPGFWFPPNFSWARHYCRVLLDVGLGVTDASMAGAIHGHGPIAFPTRLTRPFGRKQSRCGHEHQQPDSQTEGSSGIGD
jgi:hypothetical protein